MTKKQTLLSHADFQRMLVFSQKVDVFQDGELLDSSILIKSHDENVVVSSTGEHYIKENCIFIRAK